ncbi:Protein of unknown function (DUF2439) [Geosmithia morbida]|uniref:5'-3' DNA helicase ZGRF1-like N-terminal domain-containing protein n=1 Tax=Geosmithia morbida TaxID=1094350 RepID=A0A9P4YQH0_9HYPO|nr:Protein of unknown function (DUF2439) [Geosmithia morbida]KAF4119919.1 Protein of unknown function (DUF2439) [Geosmithia morbida]
MSNRVYTNISNIGPISAAAAVTTSSVHEYICLYTHDLKRKTKRWQDGKLCYHVFNGRVVVYDDRGGIVGDSHVAGRPTSLDEGEEMALDRGGAIVQRGGETKEGGCAEAEAEAGTGGSGRGFPCPAAKYDLEHHTWAHWKGRHPQGIALRTTTETTAAAGGGTRRTAAKQEGQDKSAGKIDACEGSVWDAA